MVLVVAVAALALYADVARRRSWQMPTPGKPNALRVARLMHFGDWNIEPDISYLMAALRETPYNFDVSTRHKILFADDPNLIYYPLVHLTGRGPFSMWDEDLDALRRHIVPGGAYLFADAACGNAEFDAAFRRFVAELLPDHQLVPIPRDDELYTDIASLDLSRCQYT
jgi:hypothetical protein